MSAEKINTSPTATKERSDDGLESLLLGLDELDNEYKELVLASRTSPSEQAESPTSRSSDLAIIPARQRTEIERGEIAQPHPETKTDHTHLVAFGKVGLDAVAHLAAPQTTAETQSKPVENIPSTPIETRQVKSTENGSETSSINYERARYYALLGNLAAKFVGSDSGSGASSTKANTRKRTIPIPASKEVRNYQKRVEARAIESTKNRPAVSISSQPWTSQLTPLFDTMRQQGFSMPGGETPKTPAPENKGTKMEGEADALLNTLAEEKYGVASWTQLGADEQKRIRNRALAQLHPDRGGDAALYQQVESMIMSQPLTEPLKGRPEEDVVVNTTFTTEPSSSGNGRSETPTDQSANQDSYESPDTSATAKTPLAIEAAPKSGIEAAPPQKAIVSAPVTPTQQE